MVGKIFLDEFSFNIVYNELGHNNVTNLEYPFLHSVQENINSEFQLQVQLGPYITFDMLSMFAPWKLWY